MADVGNLFLGAIDDLQSARPGVFGTHGGYARTYSLSNLSFSTGLLIGPLVSGSLTDAVGYYGMNSILGKLPKLINPWTPSLI